MRFLKRTLYLLSALLLGVYSAALCSADVQQIIISKLADTVYLSSDGSNDSYFRYPKSLYVYSQTTDGTDNGALNINGGGGLASQGRGAFITLNGNESSNGKVDIKEGSNSGGITLTAGTTTFSGNAVPAVTASQDLGTSSLAWSNTYTNNIRSGTGAGLTLRATGATTLDMYTNGTARWTVNAYSILGAGTAATDHLIATSSSDATDSNSLRLCGGGAYSAGRGGCIELDGNENANKGDISIDAGDSANSDIRLRTNVSSGNIYIVNASNSIKWTFDDNGTFKSSNITNDIGWTPVNAANQACNTTCTTGCVFGMNTGALGNFVSCTDATADTCLCAGAS